MNLPSETEKTAANTPRERVLGALTVQPVHISQIAKNTGLALSLVQTELKILQAKGAAIIERGFARLITEKTESAPTARKTADPPRPKPGTPEYNRALVLGYLIAECTDGGVSAPEIGMSLCMPRGAVCAALGTLEREGRLQYMSGDRSRPEHITWSLPGSVRRVEEDLANAEIERRLARLGIARKPTGRRAA